MIVYHTSYPPRQSQHLLYGDPDRDLAASLALTLYGHIKAAEQWTIIQQYGDWYTDR